MPVRKIDFNDKKFTVLVFPDIKRDHIRFIFSYNNQLKVLAWMKIGADGSLYLNARLPESSVIHKGKGLSNGTGGFSTFEEMGDIKLDSIPKDQRKSSYHSSGIIKSYGEFHKSTSLRDIREVVLVRFDQYTKPSRFKTISESELETTDIIVPGVTSQIFKLEESLSLKCRVFVGPLTSGNAKINYLDAYPDIEQTSILFPAVNLQDRDNNPIQDLCYQVHFMNIELGDNPNWTYTSFHSQPW